MKVQKKGGEKLPTHHYALFCPIYLMLSQFTFFQLKSNNLLSICYVRYCTTCKKSYKDKRYFPCAQGVYRWVEHLLADSYGTRYLTVSALTYP